MSIRRRLLHLRMLTHMLLGGALTALFLCMNRLMHGGKLIELLTIGSGYLSLLLTCVCLLIGPLNLLRQRRNPVNIDLRRDIGIWAGITGCLHVLLVLRGKIQGDLFLLYFLRRGTQGYELLLSLFGISNDFGLFATLLLLLLLALSNTASLRYLKGKRWKFMQRLTYLLIPLILVHTFGYQYLNLRGSLFAASVILLSLLVLSCQIMGIALTLTRRKRKTYQPS